MSGKYMKSMEDIVRQYVPLKSTPTSVGWFTIKCRVCNDHKIRGGFKFEGDALAYNCFNCQAAAVFDPNKHRSIPQKMKRVLDAYGIPYSEFNEIVFEHWKLGPSASAEDSNHKPIRFNEIAVPSYFTSLDPQSDDVYHQLAVEYLRTERGLEPTCHPFMMPVREEMTEKMWAKWKGRLIVPYFRHNKLIFYQGRDLLNSGREKYMSPGEGRDTAMYGYDEVYRYTEEPLYVLEGFFDAASIGNSVAVFSNKMTEHQIEILNRCQRPKIVVPDRRGDGYILANQGLENDWSVAFPDIGSCKDVNEAVRKYGKLFVMKSIHDNTKSGFAAEAAVALLCQ